MTTTRIEVNDALIKELTELRTRNCTSTLVMHLRLRRYRGEASKETMLLWGHEREEYISNFAWVSDFRITEPKYVWNSPKNIPGFRRARLQRACHDRHKSSDWILVPEFSHVRDARLRTRSGRSTGRYPMGSLE